MRDFASPSVKLLAPATGAFTWRFDELSVLIALFCGPSLAGGFWVWAIAPPAAKASIAAITSDLRIIVPIGNLAMRSKGTESAEVPDQPIQTMAYLMHQDFKSLRNPCKNILMEYA